MSVTALPGFDRLVRTARRYGVPVETLPAGQSPPRAGEMMFGMPVDPQLSAAFHLVGKLVLAPDCWLMIRCDDERNGFLLSNKEWQAQFPSEFWPDHFRSIMIFGSKMLYRYATVPEFANSEGVQPVIHLDPYEDIYALPVASGVDRFFDTYSRYLEAIVDDPDFKETGTPQVSFPWGVPEIIAGDQPLVEMIKMGCFDQWMYERDKAGWRDEGAVANARNWIDKILESARDV
jgi:hypothetical protein